MIDLYNENNLTEKFLKDLPECPLMTKYEIIIDLALTGKFDAHVGLYHMIKMKLIRLITSKSFLEAHVRNRLQPRECEIIFDSLVEAIDDKSLPRSLFSDMIKSAIQFGWEPNQ